MALLKYARRPRTGIAACVAVAILSMFLFAPVSATSAPSTAATQSKRFVGVPVHGTFGSGGTFQGVLDITRFAASNGNISAVGLISGTATSGTGSTRRVLDQAVRLPVTAASSTCQILHLELGPLDLDLLGLHVHLDKVVLDITATRGPGQLLGNLLCALAHLLDSAPAGPLAQLLTAVTRLVGILRLLG